MRRSAFQCRAEQTKIEAGAPQKEQQQLPVQQQQPAQGQLQQHLLVPQQQHAAAAQAQLARAGACSSPLNRGVPRIEGRPNPISSSQVGAQRGAGKDYKVPQGQRAGIGIVWRRLPFQRGPQRRVRRQLLGAHLNTPRTASQTHANACKCMHTHANACRWMRTHAKQVSKSVCMQENACS